MATPVNLLLCCAPEDERLREDLSRHLRPLARIRLITLIDDKALVPGLDENDRAVRVLDVLRYLFDAVPKRSGDRQHPYLTNLAGLSENFVISQAALSSSATG